MNQLKTQGIILSRINYREADRIITAITPDYGKISLISKGVRTLKSKLAGGIELFAVNDLSYIKGRGSLSTLTSSRLSINFPNIIKDIDRVQLGYELLKVIDRTTEEQAESEYYYLLAAALGGLNETSISLSVIRFWFLAHLIALSGHSPNLVSNNLVQPANNESLGFDFDSMTFASDDKGIYSINSVKFFRLALALNSPIALNRVIKAEDFANELMPLVNSMRATYLVG